MKKVQEKYSGKSSLEVAMHLSRVALDKKAENLVVLDVHELSSFADYFVIMSGRSTRHVQGLADAVERELSAKRVTNANTEGYQEGIWVLLDYNDVIVHIFYHESRQFYELEKLWHDAPRVPVDDE